MLQNEVWDSGGNKKYVPIVKMDPSEAKFSSGPTSRRTKPEVFFLAKLLQQNKSFSRIFATEKLLQFKQTKNDSIQ